MGTENTKSLRCERTQHFLELKGRAPGGGGKELSVDRCIHLKKGLEDWQRDLQFISRTIGGHQQIEAGD